MTHKIRDKFGKMFKLSNLMCLSILLVSCSISNKFQKKIIGNSYIEKTDSRDLILKIVDSQNLQIENVFHHCSNIDEKFKKITFQKKYDLIRNKIVLRDSNFVINLPYFNESNCKFLTEKYRKKLNKRLFDGRLIIENKQELYKIENIDTLKIIDNKLIYYKNEKNGSKGYIFDKM